MSLAAHCGQAGGGTERVVGGASGRWGREAGPQPSWPVWQADHKMEESGVLP